MASKQALLDFDLYPVTCRSLSRGQSNEAILEELIKGGARAVQLREKELPDGEFLRLARHFRQRTLESGMTFIVNDRVDVCLAVDADGVHLGQDDFPISEARKFLGPDKIIGASTHSVEEALRAVAEGADYINVGPIFATQTKEHTGGAVGVELYLKIKGLCCQGSPRPEERGYNTPKPRERGSSPLKGAYDPVDRCFSAGRSGAVKPRPALKDGATGFQSPVNGVPKTEDTIRQLVDVPPTHTDFPITVMGGINLENIDQVLRAGARRIAVVSAVVGAEDVAGAVRALRRRIENYKL